MQSFHIWNESVINGPKGKRRHLHQAQIFYKNHRSAHCPHLLTDCSTTLTIYHLVKNVQTSFFLISQQRKMKNKSRLGCAHFIHRNRFLGALRQTCHRDNKFFSKKCFDLCFNLTWIFFFLATGFTSDPTPTINQNASSHNTISRSSRETTKHLIQNCVQQYQ